jgi:putative FmdB family regulatory protein
VPLYAFICDGCGAFEVLRPMAQAAAPAPCPACGRQARRVFSPPGLSRLAAPVRRALEVEEKSAYEPNVVSSKRGRRLPHRHAPAPPWVMSH